MAAGSPAGTSGAVIHWAFAYDLLVWLAARGKERAYRERLVQLARLAPGESVLDVGCGTGTLAIVAKQSVGPAGKVVGIDPSPEMIARARKKARRRMSRVDMRHVPEAKAATDVIFEEAAGERLPFSAATFDAVLSVTMLHHLPLEARRQCLFEIRRVLRPGGRLLAVDFGGPRSARRSWVAHLRHHARFDLREVIPLLSEAGLSSVEHGALTGGLAPASGLYFVLAAAPGGD
ncbi:MAG TPA: methyltransferase domain-containing protein [Thermoanaerobaculia bacterium]|nr:methyltransferase domain-containing protein [Thermoanaerobaculia bacterium]